ncbi:hypothetical protein [Thermus filiformis]|uniref:hypothetical protein n=1 Tax=Thermus filiformis TaxID=276 RepID=UPI0005EC5A13|nr:hypothetical protein [Thermus filiformis]
MRKVWVLLVLGFVLGVSAQQGPPDPALRERFQALRPVFELAATVRLLLEMDQEKGLAFSRAQAQRLVPLLKRLAALPDLKPQEAEKALAEIEDKILTPAQLKWLDTRRLALERERQNRQGPPPGTSPQGSQAFQALARGEPFNPLRQGPAAEALKTLLARLEKR